jgi:hypothetical protein
MNYYGDDEERLRLIGSAASDVASPRGHYSEVRNFGPVQYRAVAIPHSARDNQRGE